MKKLKVVNLPAVQASLKRIDEILAEHPEIRERTAAFFAGELPGKESDMNRRTRMPQIGLRVPDEYVSRADSLIEHLQPMALVNELTRSDVMRLAMGKGLDLLESETGTNATKARKATKAKRKRAKR